MWQFMPHDPSYGLAFNNYVDERFDPRSHPRLCALHEVLSTTARRLVPGHGRLRLGTGRIQHGLCRKPAMPTSGSYTSAITCLVKPELRPRNSGRHHHRQQPHLIPVDEVTRLHRYTPFLFHRPRLIPPVDAPVDEIIPSIPVFCASWSPARLRLRSAIARGHRGFEQRWRHP